MLEPSLFGPIDEDHPLRLKGMVEEPDASPCRPLVVSWGGGVNSTALLVGLEERGIRPDLILFADTGGEKPETYAYQTELRRWLAEVDFPDLVIVQNDGMHGTLEQECLTNGVLPSKVYGYAGCSEKYKLRPMNKYLATWYPEGLICRAIGIDASESHRAKVSNDSRYLNWHPLLAWDWGRAECVEAIKRAGLPVPVKSACFYCPSSTKREVLALERDHPELFVRAVVMERGAADYNEAVKGLGRRWSWEKLVSLPLLEQAGLSDPSPIPCICDDG